MDRVGLARVSVVIPCYNYARFLPASVESVLLQEGVDVSILIIDDGSNDQTPDLSRQLAQNDSRIDYRIHAPNQGHIATYNEGFAWSTGDYTVLLSADDLLVPGALARATNLMERHPQVGFVYGRTMFLRPGEKAEAPRVECAGSTTWKGSDWLEMRCRAATNCISSPEVVIRTDLLKQLGGFRPELPHSGDLEFWMRCAAHADVGYVRGAHQAVYRIHPDSMLRQNYNAPLVDLRERRAAFDLLFREQAASIPDVERLRSIANGAMAREALWRACRAYDRGRLPTTPVAEFIKFADDIYPHHSILRDFGLRWRQKAGPRLCPLLQPLLPVPILRVLRQKLAWRSVQRRGV